MSGRCGVVVAHGELAAGFLSALARVAGPQDNLWPLSNEGRAGEDLSAAIEELLDRRAAGREAVLFSDFDGGSCGRACRRLLRDGVVQAVFFGVNLPLLIEFVFLQEEPLDKLVAAAIDKSRSALGVHR